MCENNYLFSDNNEQNSSDIHLSHGQLQTNVTDSDNNIEIQSK